jgi:hydroxymethylglutaryl-CoA lyase
VAIAAGVGDELETVVLADTMGWGHPGQVVDLVTAIRERWPSLRIGLHLHDTRGLGMANAYAGLTAGVDLFDSSIAGIGGCPFAGHGGAAGNIATEEFAFLCERLGIETGVSLPALLDCARLAEEIVQRTLPNRLVRA